MQETSTRSDHQAGFSLIELLTAVAITTVLLGLAAVPLRTYWFAQSLNGGADSLVTELRKLQEDAASESHPLVFGAKFVAGASGWTLVRYDPAAVAPAPKCTSQARAFSGSPIFNASVVVKTVTITNAASNEYTECGVAGDKILFFYARGTSTGGTLVLEQPNSGKTRTLTISVLTGRVTRT